MTVEPQVADAAVERFAAFAAELRWDELPAEVRERALIAIYDFAITARAGMAAETARVAARALRVVDGPGPCHVVGSAEGWSALAAAFANGTAAFAQNFGDTSFHTILHCTPNVVPAALAAAELFGAPGADFLAGVVAGYETAERFGRVLNGGAAELGHYRRGFHTTGTCGTLGAAGAAARTAGADPRQLLAALCVSATYASGLRGARSATAEATPLWTHGGHAAASGLLACTLAREGMTADLGALSGPWGLFAALGGPRLNEAGLTDGLGQRHTILDYAVKLYPVGHLLIPTIEAILAIRARTGWGDAASIRLRVPAEHLRIGNLDPDPRSFSRAQSSFPFIAALALVRGDVTARGILAQLGEEDVVRVSRSVEVAVDDELSRLAEEQHVWAAHAAVSFDGVVEEASAGPPRGSAQRPASWREMREKAARMDGLEADFASRAEAAIRALSEAPDVTDLAEALARA